MMFDKHTMNKILERRKTVTRRLIKSNRRPAIPNSIHKIKIDRTPKTYGYIKIIDCRKEKLKELDYQEARKEGFYNIEKYIDYFVEVNNLHNIKDDCYKLYNTPVWRVEFELLDDYNQKELIKNEINKQNYIKLICIKKTCDDEIKMLLYDYHNEPEIFESQIDLLTIELEKYFANVDYTTNNGWKDNDAEYAEFIIEV